MEGGWGIINIELVINRAAPYLVFEGKHREMTALDSVACIFCTRF